MLPLGKCDKTNAAVTAIFILGGTKDKNHFFDWTHFAKVALDYLFGNLQRDATDENPFVLSLIEVVLESDPLHLGDWFGLADVDGTTVDHVSTSLWYSIGINRGVCFTAVISHDRVDDLGISENDEAESPAFVRAQVELDKTAFDFAKLGKILIKVLLRHRGGKRAYKEFPWLLIVVGR